MRPASFTSTPPATQPAPAPTLALDIGGSTTRIGRFAAPTATYEHTTLITFPTAATYGEQLARIAGELAAARRQTDGQTSDAARGFAGVGVSFGGRITRDGQRVAVAPNLPDYEGKPLVDDLAALCGCPVRVAHDPVCGLIAERRYGALDSAERCAYLTVSTGTGAALYLGKTEVSDAAHARGVSLSIEIGHQIVDGTDAAMRTCLCGQAGCLETYTGGKQLALRYGHPLEEIDDLRVWRELTEMLAIGLVNLAKIARIELVAVSGGIVLHRDGLLAQVQHAVDRRLGGATLRLAPAQLGERAPLVGAALLLATPPEELLH